MSNADVEEDEEDEREGDDVCAEDELDGVCDDVYEFKEIGIVDDKREVNSGGTGGHTIKISTIFI